jgi:hypothetical protein
VVMRLHQLLPDELVLQTAWQERFAVGIQQPEIDRPAILNRRYQAAWIDRVRHRVDAFRAQWGEPPLADLPELPAWWHREAP